MAMTKKRVREAKNACIKRINELNKMSDEELKAELHRVWVNVTFSSRAECLMLIVKDIIDRAFPDHLLF